MRRMNLLIVLAACLGCRSITGSDTAGTTYKSDFSAQFVESSVYQGNVRLVCNVTYNLTGTVTVVIRQPGGSGVIGEGRVNAVQNWIAVTGEGCTGGPNRSTSGEWTSDLAGPTTQLGFTVQRAGGTSFVVTTTYAFSGALSGNNVTGTLVLTQTGRGITGGTVTSTSDASASIGVTLR